MQSINRTAAIIRPRQPFVDWLNSLPDDDHDYTLEELSTDNLTFLIPEADSREGAMDYIRKKHNLIFEWERFLAISQSHAPNSCTKEGSASNLCGPTS